MKFKLFMAALLSLASLVADAQGKMNLICTKKEKEVAELHSREVDSMLDFKVGEEIFRLKAKYKVPSLVADKVKRLITVREMRCFCQNYIYPDSPAKRVYAKMDIENLYQDSIDMLIIPFNTNKISGENISYALRLDQILRMDSTQQKKLMDKAIELAHKMRADREVNVWNEEIDFLQENLTNEQMQVLFNYKNSSIVYNKIVQDWIRLKKEGLTQQLDSAKEMSAAAHFYNIKERLMAIYKFKPSIRKKSLTELNKQMPAIVKMVDALDKKEKMAARKKEEDYVGNDFVW